MIRRSSGCLRKCRLLRSYTKTAADVCDYYESGGGGIKPSLSSLSFSVVDERYLTFNIPGLGKREGDESLSLFANMPPGVQKEDVKACIEESKSWLSIRGRSGNVIYRTLMTLPDNVERKIKTAEMLQDGRMLQVTLPKLKHHRLFDKKTNFLTTIYYKLRFKLVLLYYSTIPSAILTIARPFVIRHFCPRLYDSFTMFKKETDKSLHISITPGLQTTETGQGLCLVSLSMPELSSLDDVKLFYKYGGTLFIQGKAKTKTHKVQYVTAIRVPDFFARKPSMIKQEMQDGIYKATIPFVTY